MQNIYIVFTDTYSDYSIQGIFSTYEKAENFINNIKKYTGNKEEHKIEYFMLDEFDNLKKDRIFIYNLDNNGNTSQEEHKDSLYNRNYSGESLYYENGGVVGSSYISIDHAKELANLAKDRYEREKDLKITDKNYRVKHLISN